MWSFFFVRVKILQQSFGWDETREGFLLLMERITVIRPNDYECMNDNFQFPFSNIFCRKKWSDSWNVSQMTKAGLKHWINVIYLSWGFDKKKIISSFLSYGWQGGPLAGLQARYNWFHHRWLVAREYSDILEILYMAKCTSHAVNNLYVYWNRVE